MSKIHYRRTAKVFLGRWPVYEVVVDGQVLGEVHRTRQTGRYWMNSDEDRAYYLTRAGAARWLLLSRNVRRRPCPMCRRTWE